MFGGKIGAPEIILILVVVILLFGAKKLPDMARSLGKSARILKSEAKAMKSEGKQPAPAEPANPEDTADQAGGHRTIQAAPGDVSSSRPVNEPSDHTTKR
ncbi:Sec-independent protein translocase subunit TatA [Streptomyces zagrosensis]|uniref:Sec-independent protein translocase protein TatA n=1 Tax=Streptomyces zagrosensis TaxID=1042984 RepID=A0A7W9QF50_9ACTN|nr:Sec-independent protein translocase subunit TatA [Streptomyces zagrosensis]MBB5938859.1 sec-independent protein translocase protein TatA [Streptomyces zagrosensis]